MTLCHFFFRTVYKIHSDILNIFGKTCLSPTSHLLTNSPPLAIFTLLSFFPPLFIHLLPHFTPPPLQTSPPFLPSLCVCEGPCRGFPGFLAAPRSRWICSSICCSGEPSQFLHTPRDTQPITTGTAMTHLCTHMHTHTHKCMHLTLLTLNIT